jgi:hypothetical protein
MENLRSLLTGNRKSAMSQSSANQIQMQMAQSALAQQNLSMKTQEPYSFEHVNAVSFEEYIHHLRYEVFPGADRNLLKEFLYYLFYFNRTNKPIFMNYQQFILNKDLFGALTYLKSIINIEQVKLELQNAGLKSGLSMKETKDLSVILNLYVDTENQALATKLLRYLLFLDFNSLESFKKYIEQYLGYENDQVRYESVPDLIYSAYKI